MYWLRNKANGEIRCSAARKERYEQLVFLVLLLYSPLIQNAASMHRCMNDPEYGWVLVSDPLVSCEESFLRGATRVHAFATIAVIGVGLPVFILWQTLQLRRRYELTADSIYAGLFEWYSPQNPYWDQGQPIGHKRCSGRKPGGRAWGSEGRRITGGGRSSS